MPLVPHLRSVPAVILAVFAAAGALFACQSADAPDRELPQAFAPLEFLVGRWKGQGVPLGDNPAQRFRGWTETHAWAWVFNKGTPVGMSVSIEAGKVLTSGTLRYDPAQEQYVLQGKEPGPAGKALVFKGSLDHSGKVLSLERPDKAGTQRISIRANSNYVRYTMTLERKEPGASAFAPSIEVGLTKEGESFAAGASAVERPTCIVTGGAATLTVSYQGQSYPICCTGCRDEFTENPQKYLAKLARKSAAGGDTANKGSQPKASRVSKFDDAFSGDVEQPRPKAAMPAPKPDQNTPAPEVGAEPKAKTATSPAAKAKRSERLAARAATALRLAQNLEKSGKPDTALKSYKQILKDYPGTPQAKSAAERIKALQVKEPQPAP